MPYKPKILFIIDSLQTGGAETSLLNLTSRLKHFQPIVCVLYADKDDLRSKFIEKGIAIIDLNLKRGDPLWWFKGKRKFEKILNEIQPDIIHSHLYKSDIISRIASKSNKIKLIGSFVSNSYTKLRYQGQSKTRNLKLNIIKFFDRITIKKNDYIISITGAIAFENCKKLNYDINKTKIIPRGRDVSKFTYLQRKFSYPFNFIAVGRLLKSKGYIEIIKAANLLKQKSKQPFQIKIAGDGADRLYLEKMVEKYNLQYEIIFLGNRKDVPELLQKAHAFVFASHYEGQGGALVEAMLSGIPIITSDIDVFKEQIEPEKTALTFKVGDEQDLFNKMSWVMKNYEKAITMGKVARKVAEKKYDMDNIAKETEAFYLDIIHKDN